eukprot:Seg649.1 transcript_id=Seg649.1/GoldUCD/mRNA.D3Y31 product="Furin-like protease 2" protein_id=Seg649.1/GoldUCD/D3Y31
MAGAISSEETMNNNIRVDCLTTHQHYVDKEDIPNGMVPVTSKANGDCLFNSIGKLLFGTESASPILRLLATVEAVQHVNHFSSEELLASLHQEELLEIAVSVFEDRKIHGVKTTRKSLNITSWPSRCGGDVKRINFLEHVQLVISFNFTKRKNIEIEIEAPTGTKSLILRSGRRFDRLSDVNNLSILTLHHWGEDPRGIWKMRMRNVKPNDQSSGYLFKWGLIFYGTKDDPMASNRVKASMIRALNPTTNQPVMPGTSPTSSGMWTTNAIMSTTRTATSKFGSTAINHKPASNVLIIAIGISIASSSLPSPSSF